MSEGYKSLAEWDSDERKERIVGYEDGTSAIVVDEKGAVVDLVKGKHKYLTHPYYNPSGSFISLSGTLPNGSKAEWIINNDDTVLIETDKDGTITGSVDLTQDSLLQELGRKFTIGESVDAFGFASLDKVSAAYKIGVPTAEKVNGPNSFSMAQELIEKTNAIDPDRYDAI